MTAKLYDLDEDAESAPRFVVDAYDHNLVVARLAEAERLLREVDHEGQDMGGCVDLLEEIAAFLRPADSADCVHDLASDGFGRHRCSICGLTTTVAEVQK